MLSQLEAFESLILKFNPVLNLISPKDIQSLRTRHISDAKESFRIFMDIYGHSNEYSAYDLGSGNGTPGMVWAILDPSSQFTLVEIDQRKSEFLKHCVRELNLPNVDVINSDFRKVQFPCGAIIIARAFMNINKLLTSKEVNGLTCFLLKGSTWNDELSGIETLSLESYAYTLDDGTKRNLVVYKNIKTYE